MGKETGISWTHHTFNPWWGCEKVSPACAHCYAETFAKRTGWAKGSPSGKPPLWGKGSERRFFGDKHWNEPLKWNREVGELGERRRVFCASMADVFEDREELVPHRARLIDVISRTPNLDWLLLTKRPENIMRQLNAVRSANMVNGYENEAGQMMLTEWTHSQSPCPPANVWIGTTVENQEQADRRIPALLMVPAAVNFLSCEPLLGPVRLDNIIIKGPQSGRESGRTQGMPFDAFTANAMHENGVTHDPTVGKINWVICGGESGIHARPMNPAWAQTLRDQCAAAGVPFHFKQWGEWCPGAFGTNIPDCLTQKQRNDKRFYHYFDPPGGKTWRVGTNRAGRLLDGVLHDAFPTV